MRAYHRVDPLMDERKGHYTPAQLGAYLKVQLVAGRQTQRGRFRSMAVLRGILPGPYAKHIDFLIQEGDIVETPEGAVYLDGWDEWQEGDLTVRDRMTALRNRRRNRGVTETVTPPSPTANGSSVGVGIEDGAIAPSSAGDPVVSYANLTGGWPSKGATDWIDRLSERFGDLEVTKALAEAARTQKRGQIIGHAETLLETQGRELAKRERDREAEKIRERRLDGMMSRRLEWFHSTGQWPADWGQRPAA